MKEKTFYCQSCSMPLDRPDFHGTESDGSSSPDYCKYCYENGQFTVPAMTLAAMKSHITRNMNADGVPPDIIEAAVTRLPFLKRWRPRPVTKLMSQPGEHAILSPEEKHPLEVPPPPGPLFVSESDVDNIPDEEKETIEAYEPPEPGEAP